MKTLLLAAAAALLTTTVAAENTAFNPQTRQARKTSVSHVGRTSGSGSTGGATTFGTPPAENGAVNPSWQDQVRATQGGNSGSSYNSNGSAGYNNTRGLTGGGLGGYGRSLSGGGGTRGLGEGGRPDVIVPGQLIRSAGLGYKINEPETAPTLLAVEAGNKIKYDEINGRNLTEGKGVHTGPKDTPPPPNPTSGGASGNTGITENRPRANTGN